MARNRGTFTFAANFEPLVKAPLDARMRVNSYGELVLPSTWEDSLGNVWLFNGAIVVVANEPSAGIYWLSDADNYTDYSNWHLAGTGIFDPSIIFDYIDGSLAQRDSSIEYLYQLTAIHDSSILSLLQWNEEQDASIIRLDASVSELYSRDVSIGVLNVGDGSAGIFAGYDPSGNILLRTLSPGTEAVIIEEIGQEIFISMDASFAGEINIGQNIGSGDASIYAGKVGSTLRFREIVGGPGLEVSSSEDLVHINLTSEGVNGGVWITNIEPDGPGNVGDKSFSSDGVVLDSCVTDTSALIISVLAISGNTNYKPNIYINSNPVTLTADPDKPLFNGSYNMTFDFGDSSITVIHEDGAMHSTMVSADEPPEILSAQFTGGYPGTQTELKENDTYQINVITDTSIDQVIIDNYGAFKASSHAVNGTNVTVTGTIANRGTSTQDLGFRIRVRKPTGSTSENYLSENDGSVDGVNLVKLNNTYPSISIGSILYPAGQGALKGSEDASVNNTVSNFDTITYSSPNSQLSIDNSATYETVKKVSRIAGDYNINTNNFSIVANRAANDATTGPISAVVRIAHVAATLTVSNPSTRLRSGGNDGTSVQNHTITIGSTQRLLSAPTLDKDTGGNWLGGGFSWSETATSFTRSLEVHDDMSKATYNWGAISGTNLAGIETTTNSGATTYTLGGFVSRSASVIAFGTTATINVQVMDYAKFNSSLNWSFKTLPNKQAVGTTAPPPVDGGFSINALGANPTTIRILDTEAAGSSSQESTITEIQEIV